MHAQDEVVAFYYRLPSSGPEPSCGEIGLLDYGQAARFESAFPRGLTRKLDVSLVAHGNGNVGAPPVHAQSRCKRNARPI